MDFEVHMARFAPKDVARITGLTPAMQRDWRRGGYLPERESGWASFTLQEVARIALRKALADVPLGPSFATPVLEHADADRVVQSIVFWALAADDQFYDGNREGGDRSSAKVVPAQAGNRPYDLINEVLGSSERSRLLILIPSSGTMMLAMEEYRADEGAPGPVSITIYLDFIGTQLAAAAGRPLVTLKPRNELRDAP